MNRFLWAGALGASLLVAVVLRQPMVGLLLASSACVAAALGRSVRVLPWVVLALKLVLLGAVSLLVPVLWPEGGGLIPVNPDQHLYVETANRIADALRVSPLSVDYAGIVGLHNRSYSVVLGWLAYLNGGGNLFLYRLFNGFISLLLAGLAYVLARRLYPRSLQAASLVFLGVAVLPSVNAYSMFILRDVLIAAIVMSVALGLFGRRYWLTIVGLVMAYFTRFQLFFLLVGAVALFAAIKFGRRFGQYGPVLRGVLLAAFAIGGFYVAPLVLPPEYDYSHASSLLSFGRFLVHLVPSLLGLDFLLVDPGSLELGRSTLVAARLLLVDMWLVPFLFMGIALHYRRMDGRWREFYLWVWAVTIGYMAGYWIAYGTVFVRLLMPLYPLFLLAVPAVVLRGKSRGRGKAPESVHG